MASSPDNERIVAMQGAGIVLNGNFAGMVAGLVLYPPQDTNIPKVIYGPMSIFK
ncbi:MAG: hypothetical protein WBA39_16350 [Rivularia sp. (in: cyanobacteria)]